MKGIAAAFAGMFVMACSGCGGGGGSAPAPVTPTAQVQTGAQIVASTPVQYSDGRASTSYRLPAKDYGVVLPHGTAPNGIDAFGARDVFVYQSGGTYYLTYDGAPGKPNPWNLVLARSTDLVSWTVIGNPVALGGAGDPDEFCVCDAHTSFDGQKYRMYYTTSSTQAEATQAMVPTGPYGLMQASATSPTGPWVKASGLQLTMTAGTYYEDGAGPGAVIEYNGQWLMFFGSANKDSNGKLLRGIGLARSSSPDGPWTPDASPALPGTEQLENSNVFYQADTKTWFMFVNHAGLMPNGLEVDDAVWVYWTQDPTQWDVTHKAVVMDGQTSSWSHNVIGIPAVVQQGNRLVLFYDGDKSPTLRPGLDGNMYRDIGMAWIDLPIKTPS